MAVASSKLAGPFDQWLESGKYNDDQKLALRAVLNGLSYRKTADDFGTVTKSWLERHHKGEPDLAKFCENLPGESSLSPLFQPHFMVSCIQVQRE